MPSRCCNRLAGFVLFALALASFEPAKGEAPRFNVLFIAIDDLNDWVSCLGGHPQLHTPHIDRLAGRGLLFTNAHCAVPVCTPSRVAIFTGRQPWHTEVHTNADSLYKRHPDAITLPEYLHAMGYDTLGTGKLFPSERKKEPVFEENGPGFNKWNPLTTEEIDYSDEELAAGAGPFRTRHVKRLGVTLPLNRMPRDRDVDAGRIDSFDWGPFDCQDEDLSDALCAAWAAEKLTTLPKDKPFFLGVGFYRPHQPLFVPKKYFEPYPAGEVARPALPAGEMDDLPWIAKHFGRVANTSGAHDTVIKYDQWDEAVSAYLASVAFVDAQIGKVVDALDASPHRDNTLVVLWSDHGWHLGSKEHWGKFTGWERSTHVPLIIVPPPAMLKDIEGFAAGTTCSLPVSLIDLYPTLMELLEIAPPGDLDGQSLVGPMIQGDSAAWRDHTVTTFGRGNHAIRTDRWRFIHYFDGSRELYHMENDPDEFYNLAGNPELAGLTGKLEAMLPANEDVAHFVRFRDWKAVLFKDEKREPLLYGPGPEAIVEESKSVAGENPEIVEEIRKHLGQLNNPGQYVAIP